MYFHLDCTDQSLTELCMVLEFQICLIQFEYECQLSATISLLTNQLHLYIRMDFSA